MRKARRRIRTRRQQQMLGVAIYPTAQFLASYDAGRGQRYYLFGTTASFAELVGYYRRQTRRARRSRVQGSADAHVHRRNAGALQGRDDGVSAERDGEGLDERRFARLSRTRRSARSRSGFPTVIMIVPPPPGTPAR